MRSTEVRRKFNQLEGDVRSIYGLLDDIKETQADHGRRLDTLDGKVDALDGKIDSVAQRLDDKIDGVDTKLDTVIGYLQRDRPAGQ